MKKVLLAMAMLCLIGGASAQETNLEGGVMIAHAPAGLAYTSDPVDYCGLYAADPLTEAADQINRIDDEIYAARAWYVVAAFDGDKVWCGTQFGLGDFDLTGGFYLVAGGACLDGCLEIPTAGWPGPNEGTAVVATHTPWAGNYQAVYWFGGYVYGECVVPLDVDPSVGFIGFGNCEAPSQTWPAGGGAMGVLTDGLYVEPDPQIPPQACCDIYGDCVLLTPEACVAGGGIVDDAETCDPNPCLPLVRACCFEDGSCVVMLPADCVTAGGTGYDEIGCDPNPCLQPSGACCTDGICTFVTDDDCEGEWLGMGTGCDPDPCEISATEDANWGTMKSMYR